MRKTVKLPSLSRVVAGSKATLDIRTGPTYQNIVFSAAGTALPPAMFKRIDVFADGKVIMTYKDLQRLIDINAYFNRSTDTANQFVLHFFRAEMWDLVYRRAPGLGTADVQTLHIEIEIDATAPADLSLVAHAHTDPEPQPLGAFIKVREYPYSSAVAGLVEIDKLPRGAFYSSIFMFKPDVDAVEVELDGVKVVDATKSVMEREQKEASPVKRVPNSAAMTVIDWSLEGDFAQAIQTDQLQDFRLKMNLTTAGAVDIVTETLDTLGGV